MTRRHSGSPADGSARRSLDEAHLWAQEVLSAAADGEQHDEVEQKAAERHAADCEQCARFADSLAVAVPSGDRDPTTVMAEPPVALRVALAVLGLANIVVGLPMLLGDDWVSGAAIDTGHLTRDGALAVVLGVVAVLCARQPRFGRSLSPIAVAIVALHLLGGGADVVEGSVTWGFESLHLVNAFTAGLVVAAALWSRPRRAT